MSAGGQLAALVFLLSGALAQAAELEFAELKKEVQPAADAKSVIVDFPFTNKSGKSVTIEKYAPSCSCMTAQISAGKLTYAPGESGVVRAKMDLGNLTGTQEKSINLWLDQATSATPTLHLDLSVKIPTLVSLEPKTVRWETGSTPEPRTIHIAMEGGKPIHITGVSGAEGAFRYELKTLESGKKYDLVITPADTKALTLGIIRLQTDCEISKYKTQQVFAQVRALTEAEKATAQP